LSSPAKVVESAERVAETILSTYSAPNLTTEEIQSGVEASGITPARIQQHLSA
jgi:hypothetical protein